MFQKLLYKRHSNGKTGTWEVSVTGLADGTAVMTVMAAKVIGGQKVTTTTTYTEGKNIGRANETTPLQQAVSEAEAKVKKKLDNGYVENESDAQAPATNGLGFKKPMLAHPIEKVRNVGDEFYGQPKLDGHRAIATVDGASKVLLYSRQGKKLEIPHIESYWQMLYNQRAWNGQEMDGELYCHGLSLQQIASFAKKPSNDVHRVLQHHIYDTMMDAPFQQRAMFIKNLNLAMTNLVLKSSTVQFVNTMHLKGSAEVDKFHASNMLAGYEGTILRAMDGTPYEDGKRSNSLLKVKNFQDEEFQIVDVVQGIPRVTDNGTLEVAIYVCRTDDGKLFNVTAPGDMHEKARAWHQRQQAIGKLLTVKYFRYTPAGIPFHPVAIGIREDL